jgi:hypothetical protein
MKATRAHAVAAAAMFVCFVSQSTKAESEWITLGNSHGDEGGMYLRDAQDTAGQQARVTWEHAKSTMRFGNKKGDVWFFATGKTRYAFTNTAPYAYKAGGGEWSIWSDRRLKTDIRDFKVGLDAVLRLQPRTFRYNGRAELAPDDGETYTGFVAQELREVLPFAVSSAGESLDGEPLLRVDSSALTYVLINAVKEQAKTLRDLQARADRLTKAVCAEYPKTGACK